MHILLTNDDGIYAPGLWALYQALRQEAHRLWVIAPESEQSAVGHAISLSNPLRVKKIKRNGEFYGWAVSGTPADCVKIAIAEILSHKPEMVISGINQGANVGINVLYSGTVSAATEAAIMGLKAMAVSLATYKEPDFSVAAAIAAKLAGRLPELPLPAGVCLNVNVPALPAHEIKGLLWTRQERSIQVERFERRVDPRENVYYWLAGLNERLTPEPGTDYWALQQGYVSLTPIHHDLTDYQTLERLRQTAPLDLH